MAELPPNRLGIERENFFLYRFVDMMNKDCAEDERMSVKEMLEFSGLDGKCKKVLEQEDLDVICGAPDISGKEAAILKEIRMEKTKQR